MTGILSNPVPKIKKARRTKVQIGQFEDQIYEVAKVDQPLSVRHIYYRMTDPGLVVSAAKTQLGYRQTWQRVTKLRRAGRIPYSWITDATRYGYHVNTYDNAENFLARIKGLYRGDLWAQSEYRCEVWCESRSIAGVLHGVCNELAVSLYPLGGFSSISLLYQIAEGINAENAYEPKPLKIFYVGDYDPAGVLIDNAATKELPLHLDPGTEFTFERIGITAEQVEQYNLPKKERKPGEKRAKHIEWTVEAEALPATILRQILRGKIEALLPANALAVTRAAEDSERKVLNLLTELAEAA